MLFIVWGVFMTVYYMKAQEVLKNISKRIDYKNYKNYTGLVKKIGEL